VISVHLDSRRISVRRTRIPRCPQGFALIRLLCAGICNTDLELLSGYYGFSGIPGHEFVGEVVEAGEHRWIGRRVVGEINLACGSCEWCTRGLGRHCPGRSVLGIVRHPGAFREFLTLPLANLHEVPPSISNGQAVFVEPLAAACEILDQVRIPTGSAIALLGDGKLGLLIAQVLNAGGLRVHLYGRHKNNLRIAGHAGITTRTSGAKMPTAAYDWVIDATGGRDGLVDAIRMARPRGTVFLKSTVHGFVKLDTAPVIVNELSLIGSRCGRFEPALSLLESGRINVDDMIAGEFQLADAPAAFRRAAERGVLKVLLKGT